MVCLRGTKASSENPKVNNPFTYASKAGARQSRRLKQMKELGERRRLTISKSTTVKEMKVMVSYFLLVWHSLPYSNHNQLQDEWNIPTICQRLFYHDQELKDNTATVESLQIYANDVLDLQEENEVIDIDSDTEERKPRDEGRGFGGTLLGGTPDRIGVSTPPSRVEKPCSACTFSNDPDAVNCTICDTAFT